MAVSFGKILNAGDPKVSKRDLLEVLTKNLGKYYPERSHKVVHASDVTKSDFCPRQYRLLDELELKRPDTYIPAALKTTFDLGNATSDLLRNEWLGDKVIGHWKCRYCNAERRWTSPPPRWCQKSNSCGWRYQEVEFVHPHAEISGSIDVLVDLGDQKVHVVEVKIIKPDDFEKIVAPLGEHRLRTRLYLRLIAESLSPYKLMINLSNARVLYVSRGYGKKNASMGQILPFKEFVVEREDASVQPLIDRGQLVADARKNKVIPVEKICTSVACPTAKACPVKTHCWSGAY